MSTHDYQVIAASPYWAMNGVNIFSANLVRGLLARNIDAHVVLTEQDSPLINIEAPTMPVPEGVPMRALPFRGEQNWGAHWGAMIRYLEEHAPCIYIPNSDWRHSNVCSQLSPSVGVVGVVHSDDPLHYDHVERMGCYWNAVVTTSRTISANVAARHPGLANRVTTIPIGAPIPETAIVRDRDASEPLRVIYHGGLTKYQKRILDLARIMHAALQRDIPIELTIVGDGADREELTSNCGDLIGRGAVHLLGVQPHDKVLELLAEHDVYILTSEFEGMPNALSEAMGYGCVPVVTDIQSGIPDLVKNEENGYLVRVGDIDGFVNHLEDLQRYPEKRAVMSARARQAVIDGGFRAEDMVDRYVEVFDQVMEDSQKGIYKRPPGSITRPPYAVGEKKIFEIRYARRIKDIGVFPSYRTDYEGYRRELDGVTTNALPVWNPAIVHPYPNVFCSATSGRVSGVDVFSANLVRRLTEMDLSAHMLMTCHDETPPDPMPLPDDVPVEKLPVGHHLPWHARWKTLVDYLEHHKPCIYIPNYDWRHSCICPQLPPEVGVVGIVHSDDPMHYDHVKRLGKYWNAIVAVSDTIADKVLDLDPLLKSRLVTIPYGVRVPDRMPTKERADPTLRIVYAGRLEQQQKRVWDLLAIMEALAERDVPAELSLIGGGEEAVALTSAAGELMLSRRVRFLGTLSNKQVHEVMAQSDVFLLTSEFEGLPVSLLEAMAQGCVPVVTDIQSSIPDIINDGHNGYRIPIGDIQGFVERLAQLHANPTLLSRMAHEAYHAIRDNGYDEETMTGRYLALFERVYQEAEKGIYTRPQGKVLPPPTLGLSAIRPEAGALRRFVSRVARRASSILARFNYDDACPAAHAAAQIVSPSRASSSATADPSTPQASLSEYLFHAHHDHNTWQMASAERFILERILELLKPQVAIEVGTAHGGSLSVISKHAKRVYSIDIDAAQHSALSGQFDNVEFHTGDSVSVLPQLLKQLEQNDVALEFILIDGDHSTQGVRSDIESILQYKPIRPMYVLMHDSFNPECREGILSADWVGCPYVSSINVDYIGGGILDENCGPRLDGTMYGGFALAHLDPSPREHELVVWQSNKPLFDAAIARVHKGRRGLRRKIASLMR